MSASRRIFLEQSVAGASALVLGFYSSDVLAQTSGTAPASGPVFEPNAFLRIGANERITISIIRQEMGQGVRTLLPMMVAEELDADWASIRLEQAVPGARFKDVRLHTSGSGSTSTAFRTFREAGAIAREMLVAAAAETWGVAKDSCRTDKGAVFHDATRRRLTYGQLAGAAARQEAPKQATLKSPSAFKVIGQPTKRVDGPDIVSGKAAYGLDVRVPGMLFASIERAPSFGVKVKSFDSGPALKVPGVVAVVPVTSGIHPGVAVVARDSWTALKGRQALGVVWDDAAKVPFDSATYLDGLSDATSRASFKVRHEGDAKAALEASTRRLKAAYVYPFQAHACMEPMNATADVRADRAEFWIPTQTPYRCMQQIVRVTGLPEEKVTLHSMLMGGGFGRRLFGDYAAEAAEVSKAVRAPVQVFWTREDDLRHGYFQPTTAEVFEGGLDGSGNLTSFVHQTSASDLTIYDLHDGKPLWPRAKGEPRAANSYEADEMPWGAFDTPYKFATLRVDCADVTSPVPTGPWRAVEYPSTVFGRECFLDELAHASGRDPLKFRLDLLPAGEVKIGERTIERGRLARALQEAARLSGWDTPLASDQRLRGRGVAASVYHGGSFIAMVAEVSLAKDFSDLRVERVVAAIDCGIALNPLGIQGQAESGISWGLSATLLGKMNFKDGRAEQGSLGTFEVLRIDQMPKTEIHILKSDARPGGFGEHPVPHVAPAVANAVFAATGKRVRELPITSELIRRS
jgi:isoquinoline 1-oxidoreductase beta subunit